MLTNDKDRELWVKLKSEFMVTFEQKVNHRSVTVEECIPIAKTQLFDDEQKKKLRFSLQDLVTMSDDEYIKRTQASNTKRLRSVLR